jgi:hypothetical protein
LAASITRLFSHRAGSAQQSPKTTDKEGRKEDRKVTTEKWESRTRQCETKITAAEFKRTTAAMPLLAGPLLALVSVFFFLLLASVDQDSETAVYMKCVLTLAYSKLHEPVRQFSVLTHMMVLRIT